MNYIFFCLGAFGVGNDDEESDVPDVHHQTSDENHHDWDKELLGKVLVKRLSALIMNSRPWTMTQRSHLLQMSSYLFYKTIFVATEFRNSRIP